MIEFQDFLCPVCQSCEKDSQVSNLCRNCGWEFKLFLSPIPLEFENLINSQIEKQLKFREKILAEMQATIDLENKLQETRQKLKKSQKELETLKHKNEILNQQLNSYEKPLSKIEIEQVKKEIKVLEELRENCFSDDFKLSINNTIDVKCSYDGQNITILIDKNINELPDLVLGIAKKPLLRILEADIVFKISPLIQAKISRDSRGLNKYILPFPQELKKPYYTLFANYIRKKESRQDYNIITIA